MNVFQRFDDSDRDQRSDYDDFTDAVDPDDYYDVHGNPEGKASGNTDKDYPGEEECDDLLTVQFFFCPYCGEPEATQDLVDWGEGWLRRKDSDPYMLDFVCVQAHNWGNLPMPLPLRPLPERQIPLLRSGPSEIDPVSGSPTDDPMPIDVSSLIAIVCPYCAMGPSEGTHIDDVYLFYRDHRRAVIACSCDIQHKWGLLVALDNKHRRVPVTCVFLDPEYFDETD